MAPSQMALRSLVYHFYYTHLHFHISYLHFLCRYKSESLWLIRPLCAGPGDGITAYRTLLPLTPCFSGGGYDAVDRERLREAAVLRIKTILRIWELFASPLRTTATPPRQPPDTAFTITLPFFTDSFSLHFLWERSFIYTSKAESELFR